MHVELSSNDHSAQGTARDSVPASDFKPSAVQSTKDRTQELIATSDTSNTSPKASLSARYILPCISAFGSSFGLTSVVLALAMSRVGPLGFLFSTLLVILVNYVSFIVILKLGEKYKLKSFIEISNLFEHPGIKIAFRLIYFGLNFGIMLTGAIEFSNLTTKIMRQFGAQAGWLTSPTSFTFVVLLHVLTFPLLMKRKLSDLKIVTVMTFVACFYLTLFLLVSGIQKTTLPDAVDHFFTFRLAKVPAAFSILFFAFSLQINLFSMYSELPEPSIKNLKPIIFTNFGLLTLFYFVMGFFGFLYAADRLPELQNERVVLNLFGTDNLWALLCRALMLITALNTFLYTFKPTKDIIIDYLDDEVEAQPVGPRGTRLETAKILRLNMIVTVGLALASMAFASIFVVFSISIETIIDFLANAFMPVLFVFIPLGIFARSKPTPPVIIALVLCSFFYMCYFYRVFAGESAPQPAVPVAIPVA